MAEGISKRNLIRLYFWFRQLTPRYIPRETKIDPDRRLRLLLMISWCKHSIDRQKYVNFRHSFTKNAMRANRSINMLGSSFASAGQRYFTLFHAPHFSRGVVVILLTLSSVVLIKVCFNLQLCFLVNFVISTPPLGVGRRDYFAA